MAIGAALGRGGGARSSMTPIRGKEGVQGTAADRGCVVGGDEGQVRFGGQSTWKLLSNWNRGSFSYTCQGKALLGLQNKENTACFLLVLPELRCPLRM